MPPRFRGPTGTVGIVSQEVARYTAFWNDCLGLKVPAHWVWRVINGYDTIYGRNKMVKEFDGDWLVFLDDDHMIPPNLIERLLSHDEPIVAAHCLKRYPPFRSTAHIDGKVIRWQGEQGLLEVDSCGCAGMLIHRSVFEAIGEPYFRGGKVYEDRMAEDIDFCRRAREAGFKIHVDLSTPIGHYTSTCVVPLEGAPCFVFGAGAEYRAKGTFNYGAGADTYPLPKLKAVS